MKNKFFLFILVFFLSGSLTFAQEAPVETATEETTAEQPVDQTAAEAETAETDAAVAEAETAETDAETAEAEEGAEGEAHKATLLDFSLLTAGEEEDGQNPDTIIELADYSTYALSEEERAEFDVSLAIEQWRVKLNSSAAFPDTMAKSMVKEVEVTDAETVFGNEKLGVENPGKVLGVRANFPQGSRYAYADIVPPFEIPVYYKKPGTDEFMFQNGRGAIDNVKNIKKISAVVCGRNYPHKLQVVLRDSNYNEKVYTIGDFNFTGWQRLEWENPNYIANIKDRDLKTAPTYPMLNRGWKVIALRIVKDIQHEGGDFIGYIKQIDIEYDKDVIENNLDIDDDAYWNIVSDYNDFMSDYNFSRLGEQMTLEYIEKQRMNQN